MGFDFGKQVTYNLHMYDRKIIHIDMDCFYAAVEEKLNPKLKGIPMAVGGSANSRGVICTANYEARKFGVKAAVPSSQAQRMCPQLVIVPPNFQLYKAESAHVREIFGRFTDKIQPLSLDEAYLDVTEASDFQGSATRIAAEIRRLIQAETKLTASAGIAPNKFLAKIASDWKKPNGQFVIRPEEIDSFVLNLPVEKIWGVGKVTAERMHRQGFYKCSDLQKLSWLELKRLFGASRAQELYFLSRGHDDRPVRVDEERKSLSVEETYARDLSTWEEIDNAIPSLYADFNRRLKASEESSRICSAIVKMKYRDFKGTTHQKTTKSIPDVIDFQNLLKEAWLKKPEPVRLLGVGVRLQPYDQIENRGQLGFQLA
ncbi:MAG: DNA polymerase IV [Bdellovibrionota bacterium]